VSETIDNTEEYYDIYSPETANPRYQGGDETGYIPLFDALLEHITMNDDFKNVHPMLQLFRGMETGGAINDGVAEFPHGQSHLVSDTGAAGTYQFRPNTVTAAKTRAQEIGLDPRFLETLPDDPREWTQDQADIMVLVNLFPRVIRSNERTVVSKEWGRPGMVDDLLQKALVDLDRNAMNELYLTLHHTSNPKKYPKNQRGIPHSTRMRLESMKTPTWDIDMDTIFELIDGFENVRD